MLSYVRSLLEIQKGGVVKLDVWSSIFVVTALLILGSFTYGLHQHIKFRYCSKIRDWVGQRVADCELLLTEPPHVSWLIWLDAATDDCTVTRFCTRCEQSLRFVISPSGDISYPSTPSYLNNPRALYEHLQKVHAAEPACESLLHPSNALCHA